MRLITKYLAGLLPKIKTPERPFFGAELSEYLSFDEMSGLIGEVKASIILSADIARLNPESAVISQYNTLLSNPSFKSRINGLLKIYNQDILKTANEQIRLLFAVTLAKLISQVLPKASDQQQLEINYAVYKLLEDFYYENQDLSFIQELPVPRAIDKECFTFEVPIIKEFIKRINQYTPQEGRKPLLLEEYQDYLSQLDLIATWRQP